MFSQSSGTILHHAIIVLMALSVTSLLPSVVESFTAKSRYTSRRHQAFTLHLTPVQYYMPPPPPPAAMILSEMKTYPTAASDISSALDQPLQQGIRSFLREPNSIQISEEARKKPTKEEIDAKKFTFNLWFWGGGFVAPFLATIFYFGFKFWEK